MLKYKFLTAVFISAFAGSVAAADVAVTDQAVTIKSNDNLTSTRGATITLANGVVWNIDSAYISVDGKKIEKHELKQKNIKGKLPEDCLLTGTRASGGVNTAAKLICK